MPELPTPVVLIIFNRPHLVRQVWETIRAARPSQLFVVADGPRPDRPEDAVLCAESRAIVAQVDWPCQVERNYAGMNLGCDPCIVQGITWAFTQVEEAIILEDDILPDPSFFPFCQDLLTRFRDDGRVMGIGGFNFLGQWQGQAGGYHLHRRITTWGWATWRKAWRHFECGLDWERTADAKKNLAAHLPDSQQADYQSQIFDIYAEQPSMGWDTLYGLICNLADGLWLSPSINLITNLGFGSSATHTKYPDDLRRFVQRSNIPVLRHSNAPMLRETPTINDQFDRWLFLLEVLNTYRHPRGLHLWYRVMAADPDIAMPEVPGGGRAFLAPLQNPAELLTILDYVTPFMADNPRLHRMKADLAALAARP
jgi:hypothetical protein